MKDRQSKYPQHTCGWWHNPETTPCPTPLEMHRMARADYEEERSAATQQGMTEEQFDKGWERRAQHS